MGMIMVGPALSDNLVALRPPIAILLAPLLGASDLPPEASKFEQIDAEDVRSNLNGDEDAYQRLVERHQAGVGRIMWRFSRDRTEHEELVQRVFVEAYLSLSSYRAEAPFAHWLARIATRVGYKYWRETTKRDQQAVTLSAEIMAGLAQHTDDGPAVHEAAELVHHLLAQLPPAARLVLTLRYLEQCDIEQTAYRTGWSKVRVRVQTHRAISQLRKLTAKAGIEWSDDNG